MRCTARCSDRPMAALHFLLPTGHSRSGRRSSIPNISLLPLDEVPVHVHPFAARVPCDSKGSECQCGVHTAEAASALRSRKTERAAKEKPTPISQFFLAPAAPPKIGQQLAAQPTPRFRVMSEAMSDVEIEALIDPLPPFTFCRPFSFDSKLIW